MLLVIDVYVSCQVLWPQQPSLVTAHTQRNEPTSTFRCSLSSRISLAPAALSARIKSGVNISSQPFSTVSNTHGRFVSTVGSVTYLCCHCCVCYNQCFFRWPAPYEPGQSSLIHLLPRLLLYFLVSYT